MFTSSLFPLAGLESVRRRVKTSRSLMMLSKPDMLQHHQIEFTCTQLPTFLQVVRECTSSEPIPLSQKGTVNVLIFFRMFISPLAHDNQKHIKSLNML